MPRATDEANLRAMGDMILALERNGHTYRRDGSIYFKIASLPNYGRLARLDHDGMQAGARVDVDEYSKDDARDFVLWKATEARRAVVGLRHRPGPARAGTSSARRWRCGCSASAPIDIHAGGIDLIFPHHENEIAQAEGATKQPFSRFWVHVEHLFVENEKMSKSLGNVYTRAGHRRQRATGRRRCATCCCRRTTASSSTSPGPAWSRPRSRCAGSSTSWRGSTT